MARSNFLFTSESVSEGHPDKVCDRISDAVVDLYLAGDPFARVACETLTTTNKIVLAGEVRGPASITKDQIEETARKAVKAIGYEQDGFHWKTADCEVLLHAQSADIAQGVDAAGNKDEGAGDQGIMFGYACTETDVLMPSPIFYSHRILKRMADERHSGKRPEFEPDAKSQVTMKYENGKPVGVTSVVVSTQHKEGVKQDDLRELFEAVKAELPNGWFPPEEEFYVNPTGKFVIGGPDGDAGLTGRKIIDTYGAGRLTAAAPSPARIRRRLTVRRPMPRAILPKTLWRQASPSGAPSSFPMRLASRSRFRSIAICTVPARSRKRRSRRLWRSAWISLRAASASISSSTGRSTSAPPPTVISDASRILDGGFSWEKTDIADKIAAEIR